MKGRDEFFGLISKEIGVEMGVKLRTIKEHRVRVMQKKGVVSVVDLVRLALKAGVAPAQPGVACRHIYSSPGHGVNNSSTLTRQANYFA